MIESAVQYLIDHEIPFEWSRQEKRLHLLIGIKLKLTDEQIEVIAKAQEEYETAKTLPLS